MAAWNVRDMDESETREAFLKLFDEISGGNLLVVEVVEQAHLRVSSLLNNLKGFGDLSQEILRVFFGIDGLQQQAHRLAVDRLTLDEIGGGFHRVDTTAMLDVAR